MTYYRNRYTSIDLQDEEDLPPIPLSIPPALEDPPLNVSLEMVKEESSSLAGPYPAARVLQKHHEMAARAGRHDQPFIDYFREGSQVILDGVKAVLLHIGQTGRQILGTIVGGIIVVLFLSIRNGSTAERGRSTQVSW